MFLLLFAGHGMYSLSHIPLTPLDHVPSMIETTAHTLAATLGLLALHQDIQNEILQHILGVIGPTREPASFHFHFAFTEASAHNHLLLDI